MSANDPLEDQADSSDQSHVETGGQSSTSPASTPARERSTIEFPYQDLNDAIEIAKTVHKIGGQSCQIEQLAAELKVVAKGGGFRLRVLTAGRFNLIKYDKGTVILTPLGIRICDPKQEAAAKIDAFLGIPLYKAVYEKFKGGTLPPITGLEAAMVTLGVAQKQKDKARQVFMRSAQQADFFKHGTERLVIPSVTAEKPKETEERKDVQRQPPAGDQIKTVALPEVGGQLTISGTFNVFELDGAERELVFSIVDMMKNFERKSKKTDSAS